MLLPFLSIRCDSESSVAVASTTALSPKHSKTRKRGGEENLKMKKNEDVSKASIFSQGLHRLIRRFKSFSQLFVYKEEMGHVEKEMEIGFPTDVKHVTHIGVDGSTTVNPVSNWENLKATEILSFPSISLQQFELAMANQTRATLGISGSTFI
ncbi:hypothetical protein DH2020_043374 [Rehmannia glutinosa]|uniref:CRIB domain-containing protein n=1 Tax=Rehmannia glutinosa TaxID=99300 RepID=A0ABR0UJR9_REHGL